MDMLAEKHYSNDILTDKGLLKLSQAGKFPPHFQKGELRSENVWDGTYR